MLSSLSFCLRQLLFLCIPCAVFTVVFRYDLVQVFYQGGRFGEREVSETAYALGVYAMGIPAFATIKVTVASFYSRKMMRIPVRTSVVCIVMNIVLNLILMWPLKQAGIALATVISSYANNGFLLWMIGREFRDFDSGTSGTIGKSLSASLLSVFLVVCVEMQFLDWFMATSKLGQILRLTVFCGLFGILYLLFCHLLKAKEMVEIVQSLSARFKRGRQRL
jgi:putative peptidoglycan lipid II flippase